MKVGSPLIGLVHEGIDASNLKLFWNSLLLTSSRKKAGGEVSLNPQPIGNMAQGGL